MFNDYIDFFHDIFEKQNGVPVIYSQISHSKNNQILFNSIDESLNEDNKLFFRLKYVPDYLDLKLKQESLFKTKVIKEVKGYSCYLQGFNHVNEYLKVQFSPKKRSAIKKYIRRLETSFNIRYKMFYGHIDEAEYNFIMNALRNMLDARFKQRQETDIYKSDWDKYKALIIKLIKLKKGSLFVVYNESEPIAITANYHFNNKIFFYGIPSYNIDYASFRLGHVVLYKEIDWCIKNNYLVFETGRGDFEYKKQWCNNVYNFNYNLIYKKNSIPAFFAFKKEYFKHILIKFLREKKVNVLFYQIKNKLLNKKSKIKTHKKQDNFRLVHINETEVSNYRNEINPFEKKYSKLRKPIYDFLYLNKEHVSNIKIYTIKNQEKFLIKGKSNKQLIIA